MRQNEGSDHDGDARFNVIRPLGRGGFGAVYEALDRNNGQRVALKQLTRVSPSALFRFKQEFRALADIHHRNLVRLHELIEQEGRWYIVMELVEGIDLLQYVACNGGALRFDEARLRTAFAEVANGLEALHACGILHRDLKPSNVLVTPEGRAVLLDFGLVTREDARDSTQLGVGTVLYMAPEQVDGRKLGRATDWYAFGSSLYEALTGQPPYEGTSTMRIALDKQRSPPRPPDSLVSGLPADLSELSMQLLQIEPQQRPHGREVLRILRREAPRTSFFGGPPNRSVAPERLFAGRDTEMEHLDHALARTHRGELRIVLIEGESGVGKSELVAEFLRRQEQKSPNVLALRGRCYENEQVSYKAFDGCMDALARRLRRMGRDAASLMPVRAPLLAQLFPVLADVNALIHAPSGNVAADPAARRLQAFAALSALLGNLAEERPIILVIDDLQWADAESFRMLRALIEDQARPPILVLATVRPREELEGDVLASIETVREWQCTDVVSLLGLPREQAETLAKAWLGPAQDPSWTRTIAIESRGHPLFLAELIQFAQSRDLGASGGLTLEAAVRARIARLPREARALLDVVALAARPHLPQLFARALGLASVDESLRILLSHKLLRTRRKQEVGCYHDRIRHVVTTLIPSTRLPELHRTLAAVLADDTSSDATEEATHWDAAGEPERALDAYERAARRAFEALAFTQAERLLARALALTESTQHARYASLTADRAHALACAGQSAQAAETYRKAAALCSDEGNRLLLLSRMALQLIVSGQVQAGLQTCRELFARFGVGMPRSDLGALALAFWHRLWTRFSRYNLLGDGREAPQKRLLLDLIDNTMGALLIVNTSAFLALNAQHARIALSCGDRWHARSAYAFEGWLHHMRGRAQKAAQFFAVARRLADATTPDPARVRAHLAHREGSALLANWQWAEATALLQEAEELYKTQCAESPWWITVVRYHLGLAWYRMGQHAHLAREMDAWIHEAEERKDPLAVSLLSGMGHGAIRHLMRTGPEAALRELNESTAHLPETPFSFPHFGHLLGTQYARTLEGGRAAWDMLEQRKKQHERAFLLRARAGKDTLVLMRSQAALRALETARDRDRDALLKFVERSAHQLQRRNSPFAQSYASLFLAELSTLRGDTDAARRLSRKARLGFEKIDDHGAQAATYLEGVLEGGQSGRDQCAEVLAFYENQGWRRPEDAVTLQLPTLPILSVPRESQRTRRQMIQHYEVLRPLGSGGFGSVVEARDTRSGEHVALKELVNESARSLERFKREFRALRELHHPNLVRFDALFETQGHWYIVMELVRGEDLATYVRPQGRLDADRLRKAFGGLLAAVRTLHDAGLVHRDISDDNVWVDEDGRAVVLDFGLIAREHSARDADAVGNVDYAPPEQLEGVPPHRSADAYALGACLYHALTGRLPVELPIGAHAISCKRGEPPAQPDVPEELAPLASYCLRLLSPEPAARPSLAELSPLLSRQEILPPPGYPQQLTVVAEQVDSGPFAGRCEELAVLRAAAQRAQNTFALALVEGASGLGKTALASEFVRVFEKEEAHGWVLHGRCYENERLSLKAFDGVADQLARNLRNLPPLACEGLLPRKAALLSQLFPVLGSVSKIAEAAKKGLPADPAARRSLALRVFTELLEHVARAHPVLVVIDDLQWADSESLALLEALATRSEALPLLLLATLRPSHEIAPDLRPVVDHLKALPDTHVLTLGGLDAAASEELAATMLGPSVSPALLARLAQESQGHPLFLRELVEHARAGDLVSAHTPVSLDGALAARIARVRPEPRDLLHLVALADKPYPIRVFASAMAIGSGESSDAGTVGRTYANELLNHGLLRRRGDTSLACYHDRVRHVALAHLQPTERARLAACLARALDLCQPQETAERARLWSEAGHLENACAAHEEAGDVALATLAFAQAEEHYARALEIAGPERDERFRRLTIQRAHAFVRIGKNAEAAHLYADAAETTEGEQRVRLRIWAAQNLIQGAHVEEGLRAASKLFGELGIPFPRSERSAVGRIAWESLRLRLGGSAQDAEAGPLAPTERLALDALNELSQPVASVQFLQGAALSAQHVRRALRAHDPGHAARALAYEGILRTTRKPLVDHSALFTRAHELAESTGDPAVIAAVEVRHGIACLAGGDFLGAQKSLLSGYELTLTECPAQPWLLTTSRMQLGCTWFYLGEHARLAAETERWVLDAQQRGDSYAYAALSGAGCAAFRHLMRGEPDAALSELTQAMSRWPTEPFSTLHVGALMATLPAYLYRGGDAALRYLASRHAVLERAAILRSPIFQVPLTWWRANAALAAMSRKPTPQDPLLRQVRHAVRVLRKIPLPLSAASAELLDGTLSMLDGDRERALGYVRTARQRREAVHHTLSNPAAYLEGWLEGGAQGAERCGDALSAIRAQGWSDPMGYVALQVPALRLFEPG